MGTPGLIGALGEIGARGFTLGPVFILVVELALFALAGLEVAPLLVGVVEEVLVLAPPEAEDEVCGVLVVKLRSVPAGRPSRISWVVCARLCSANATQSNSDKPKAIFLII